MTLEQIKEELAKRSAPTPDISEEEMSKTPLPPDKREQRRAELAGTKRHVGQEPRQGLGAVNGSGALRWTAEKPKRCGWWWAKGNNYASVTPVREIDGVLYVRIYEIDKDCPVEDERINHWRWAGPLDEPEEAPDAATLPNDKLTDSRP